MASQASVKEKLESLKNKIRILQQSLDLGVLVAPPYTAQVLVEIYRALDQIFVELSTVRGSNFTNDDGSAKTIETLDGDVNRWSDYVGEIGKRFTSPNDKSAGGKSGGSRFWEYYAVRYFGGTFVAAVCILGLFGFNSGGFGGVVESFHELVNILHIEESTTAILSVYLGIAFTFSYIASAPIYVLHLFRSILIVKRGRHSGKYTPFSNAVSIIISISLLSILVLSVYYYQAEHFPKAIGGVVALAGFIAILTMQYIVIGGYFINQYLAKDVADFYEYLANARSNRWSDANQLREYVESYRGLREHGNAFLLIIANFLFATILSTAPNVPCLMMFVVLWTSPAVIGWFAASMLESQL